MKPILAWALARLSEPSTYAGLSGLIATATFLPGADLAEASKILAAAAIAIPAMVAVVKADSPAK